MLSSRYIFLIVLLLAVQAWSKPVTSTDAEEYSDDDPKSDYNDDETLSEDDEDPTPTDDNDLGNPDEPPQIISQPQSYHVRVGSDVSLPCLVKNTEGMVVTWKRDNEFLYTDETALTSDSERITRLPDNTLVIHNATVSDSSDQYECSILTKPESITITHRLLVDPERSTTSPPAQPHKSVVRVTPGKRVEASAGESITLGCEMKTHSTPEVKWYHKSEKVGPNVIVNGNHITIKNINRHDAGDYQCLMEDGTSMPPHAGINVIVHYAPEIEAKRELVHTGLGVKSELTCIVHAHPHANVLWYKDQTQIPTERGGRIRLKANKTVHHLEIHHTQQDDLGQYKCVAINKMGQAEKMITLTGAPSQAIIYGGEMTRTDSGLILKWRLESYSPITEYKLQYRRKGDENWNVVKPTVTNGSGNQFTVEHPIEGLQPGSYEAILMARNNFGWSQPSVPHMFTGEYALEDSDHSPGAAATIQPLGALIALFLVVSSGAFSSL